MTSRGNIAPVCTIIATIASVIGAAGAISIPFVLDREAEENRISALKIATETRTLQVMDDLDEKITKIVDAKIKLDAANKASSAQIFSAAYIDSDDHAEVQTQVYRLLNLYDSVCLGAKAKLFSQDIIERMRGDALRQTWHQYGGYIADHRKAKLTFSHAWENCDSWVAGKF